ncbi:hypothetical protein GWK08_12430 [Leptobacterium flavescens]|uniref:Signal transduction histidine kinase internal region domain-containing protein n=1 Tax=Leptobacterium flavescens TaxID=472055 RepID=A0A6P0ULM9_9FLAO|nr:histidine kinase [Leptobacterium flavescens]NER14251.1 hypothetical protein [Leptobacterium flavescens]
MLGKTDTIINRRFIAFIAAFYFMACFLDILGMSFQKFNKLALNTWGWGRLLSSSLANYTSKFVFIVLAVLFTAYLIRKKVKLVPSILIHTVISIILSFYSTVFIFSMNKFVYGDDVDFTWVSIYSRGIFSFSFNFFVYFSIIIMVYAYNYFRNQKEYQVKEARLRTQLLDSKIRALQSQLQPHFLFNALNDISSLIDIDTKRSQDAIADLSEMLRSTLNLKDVKQISLREELDLLEKYIDIEKIRYAEKISFKMEVSPDLLNIKVPPLLLQPIVENSIRHGFSYEHDKLMISIRVSEENGSIRFELENNGKAVNENEITYGTGITNILERMDTLYDGRFFFEMKNSAGEGVITIIKIPSIKEREQ